MKIWTNSFRLYYLPIIFGLIIALSQFILSNFFTLTKWEGGGFGMYSEPNPHNSRIVGILLESRKGSLNIRLYPTDKKLLKYVESLEGDKKYRWDQLLEYSRKISVFPMVLVTDNYLKDISKELLNINKNLELKFRDGSSLINVYFYVNQLNVTVEDNVFKTNKIYSKSLEI